MVLSQYKEPRLSRCCSPSRATLWGFAAQTMLDARLASLEGLLEALMCAGLLLNGLFARGACAKILVLEVDLMNADLATGLGDWLHLSPPTLPQFIMVAISTYLSIYQLILCDRRQVCHPGQENLLACKEANRPIILEYCYLIY